MTAPSPTPSHRARPRRLLGLAAAAALAAAGACGGADDSPFQIELVTSAGAVSGTCPAHSASGIPKTGPDAISTLRVTFYDASQGAPSRDSVICERLVGVGRSEQPFYIPAPRDALLHIQVQAFGAPEDATPLVASGLLLNVPFSDPKAAPRMFLAMAGRLGCVPGPLSEPRAFHTATALPGGYALIAGGAVALSETGQVDPSQGLQLTDRVELYDPQTAEFVDVGQAAYPRAFHAAFLLPGSDAQTAHVLLVGGVGLGALAQDGPVLVFREGPNQPLPISPNPNAASPPAEILHIDLTTSPPTITGDTATPAEWPARMLGAAGVYSLGWPLTAGGIDGLDASGAFTPSSDVDIGFDDGSHHPLVGALVTGRAAFTVSSLTPARALVWGGNFNETDPAATVAELLTISPAPPSATALAFDPVSSNVTPVSTAFHTATPLPDGSVLVAGGLQIQGGTALQPPAGPVVSTVTSGDATFSLRSVDSSALAPVAYHAAVDLPDGSVLLTGGAVSASLAQTHCPGITLPAFCALRQAARYDPGDAFTPASLQALPEPGLSAPRFGHAMVRLSSGLVLVTGGLRWGEASDGTGHLFVDGSAEVYNPADGSPESDIPLGRPRGALSNPDGECPASWD